MASGYTTGPRALTWGTATGCGAVEQITASGWMYWAAYNPFRFSTKYDETTGTYAGRDTGLYDYGQRWFSPGLGRFITRDPAEEAGGVNLYGAMGNNLVNNIDPLGLKVVAKVAIYGFQPFGFGVGGERIIDQGADANLRFSSTDTSGAEAAIIKAFGLTANGKPDPNHCPPYILDIVGYSWGGWSALQVANDLNHNGNHYFANISDLQINIGLIDPVDTLRSNLVGYRSHYAGGIPGHSSGHFVVDDPGVPAAQKPPNATFAGEVYETNGQAVQFGSLVGSLFIGVPVPGFNALNLTSETINGHPMSHVGILSAPETAQLIRTTYSGGN